MEYLKQYEILLKKARTDIAVAETLHSSLNQDIDEDVVLFHLQQATEKLLKATLASSGRHFPKTHDTELLFDNVKNLSTELYDRYNFLSELDDYAVEGRYGDVGEGIKDIEKYLQAVKDLEQEVLLFIA